MRRFCPIVEPSGRIPPRGGTGSRQCLCWTPSPTICGRYHPTLRSKEAWFRVRHFAIDVRVAAHPAVPRPPGLETARPPTHVEALARQLPSHLIVRGGGCVGSRNGPGPTRAPPRG